MASTVERELPLERCGDIALLNAALDKLEALPIDGTDVFALSRISSLRSATSFPLILLMPCGSTLLAGQLTVHCCPRSLR